MKLLFAPTIVDGVIEAATTLLLGDDLENEVDLGVTKFTVSEWTEFTAESQRKGTEIAYDILNEEGSVTLV